ncbi:putative reverse transcriptase zinc-binding domain-containing protein [Helianthus annuus]|nr:putative reverse transcriptase zinc-binding domain-containing protein [Helianthus annuus]
MRRFLWAQGNSIKGKAKVKWSNLCFPKQEGGLGIRRVLDMNNALMVSHVWSILTSRESLWVKWIHLYHLRDRSFWDVPVRNNVAWSCRKMLQLRPIIRKHIWMEIGDGHKTFAWFDIWDDACPLSSFLIPRMIANAGFGMQTKVAELWEFGGWRWLNAWVQRFPSLQNMRAINLNPSVQDRVVWRSSLGSIVDYGTSMVWEEIQISQSVVPWANIVWFSQAIPRHSFVLWLLIKKKLKTQDVMRKWCSSGNMNFNLMCCSLCTSGPDSHEHLFFECSYACCIWHGVRDLVDMGNIDSTWDAIYTHLLQHADSKKVIHIVGRLVVGAAVYFVWQERNQRLFSSKKRSQSQLVEVILNTVRMKLHSMKFKKSVEAMRVLHLWSLPRGLLIDDDDYG